MPKISIITILCINFLLLTSVHGAFKCSNPETVEKLISTLHRSIDYLKSNEKLLIGDVFFGLTILKYVVESILDDINVNQNLLKDDIVKELRVIWSDTTEMLKRNPLDFNIKYEFGENIYNDIDTCYYETFRCKITKKCWLLMQEDGFKEYFLTHRALYFSLAYMNNCHQEIAEFEQHNSIKNINTAETILKRHCRNIYVENAEFARKHFGNSKLSNDYFEDLFMEQLAVCGMSKLFTEVPCITIDFIISWQHSDGCYRQSVIRQKRDDKIIDGTCSEHKTAVALGALSSSLHCIILK